MGLLAVAKELADISRQSSSSDQAAYDAEDRLERWFDHGSDLRPCGTFSAYGYDWRLEREIKFLSVEEVQIYVDRVLAWIGYWKPIRVRRAKAGSQDSSMSGNGTLTLPEDSSSLRETTVLHEIAHHLAPADNRHGERFRAVLVQLLADTDHPTASRLLALSYQQAG